MKKLIRGIQLFNGESIIKKLLKLMLFMIFGMFLIFVVLNYNSRRVIGEYDHMLNSIILIDEIKSDLEYNQQLIEEYIVTGNRDYKSEYYEADFEVKKNFVILENYIDGNESKLLYVNIDHILKNYRIETRSLLRSRASGDEDYLRKYNDVLSVNQVLDDFMGMLLSNELSVNRQSYEMTNHETKLLLNMVWIICFFIFLVSIIYTFKFSKELYEPIQRLVNSASGLVKGELDTADIIVEKNDEIGYLTKVFNEMKTDLKGYIHEKEDHARLEALLKEAELKALQSQINPHFLFNTLSMVTESALIEGADETLKIIEEIAYMLRYSLTGLEKKVLIEDEIKMIKSYIFLQERRFDDRIKFNINIDGNMPKLDIPGMTIQPIIENAVIHGLEGKIEGGLINIDIENQLEKVVVRITDDGVGINPEKLKMIYEGNKEEHKGHTTGIGLKNVMERIRIVYNQPGLVEIYNKKTGGTCIVLNYPKIY